MTLVNKHYNVWGCNFFMLTYTYVVLICVDEYFSVQLLENTKVCKGKVSHG